MGKTLPKSPISSLFRNLTWGEGPWSLHTAVQLNISAQTLLTNCNWMHFYSCFKGRLYALCASYTALPTLMVGSYVPASPRPLRGGTSISHLPTPHFISITEAPSGWEDRLQRQRKTAPAKPLLGILLLFLALPVCFFSLFGCWPPTEQDAFSLAVTARAAKEAVTHLLPLLATWIGSAFVWHVFMVVFLMCTLSIFSSGVKRIIKKNKKEKKN